MHRTEGEDYILEGGKRRFAAANPPTQKATRLPAEFMNAVQEEICNVIAAASPAIPLNLSASIDRAAGWNQLLKALQEGKIIKSTSFASDALSKGLVTATGFEIVDNYDSATVEYVKSMNTFPFFGIYGTFKTPDPTAPRVSQIIPLNVLTQVLGGTKLILIESPQDTAFNIKLNDYCDDWTGNITFVLTNRNPDQTFFIEGPAPKNATITIINAGWAPLYDSESSYGRLTWTDIGISNAVIRSGYTKTYIFNNNGAMISSRTVPQHDTTSIGTPAMWSRLHGIYDMAMRNIETPITTPSVGDSTYPFPLLDLSQTSDAFGGMQGAGIRVAGNVGVELPRSSVSRLANSRKRRTGRVYYSLDNELMFDRGTDQDGVSQGQIRIDRAGVFSMMPYNFFETLSAGTTESPLLACTEGAMEMDNFTPHENCIIKDFGVSVNLYSATTVPVQLRFHCTKLRVNPDLRGFTIIQTAYADMLPFAGGDGGQYWRGKLSLNNAIVLRPGDYDSCAWTVSMPSGFFRSNAGIFMKLDAMALGY